ncbi:hypothetical protein [uncultured Robinsoniella sp.]|uniref:hypothetical protein n=1 Tax=uncultured Robinsoniella sp. TaxID=904190 RepID=UPI00374E4BB9
MKEQNQRKSSVQVGKRVLSILLVCVMVLSSGLTAFAQGGGPGEGMKDLSTAVITISPDFTAVFDGTPKTPDFTVTLADGTAVDPSNYAASYNYNINARNEAWLGEVPTLTIQGIEENGYTGKAEKHFTIEPADINTADLAFVIDQENPLTDLVYTGEAVDYKAQMHLKDNNIADQNYAYLHDSSWSVLNYSGNIDATQEGSYITAEISADAGNYTGTRVLTLPVKILPKPVSGETFKVELGMDASTAFTGEAVEPEVIVTDGLTTLSKDNDYTVSYSGEHKKANEEVTVTVTGIGNYTGNNESLKFVIGKKLISHTSVTMTPESVEDQSYTGSELKPEVTLKDGGKALVEDTDYTIAYKNNINVGKENAKAEIEITGIGDYSGTRFAEFKVVPCDLSKEENKAAIGPIADQVYNAKGCSPEIKVAQDKKELVFGTDYSVTYENNDKASTDSAKAVAKVTGKGNYCGEITKEFIIQKKSLLSAEVKMTQAGDQEYTSMDIEPEVVITDNGEVIPKDQYIVEYKNNHDLGTATILVTGQNNYKGTIEQKFTIIPADINKAYFTYTKPVYDGTEKQPLELKAVMIIGDQEIELIENTDYKITEYADNTNSTTEDAKAKITIEGIGNYQGKIEGSFDIDAKNIGADDISIAAKEGTDYTYTGKEIKPELVVKDKDVVLTEGTDFTVKFAGELVNVSGTAVKVTIIGMGNYTGTNSIFEYTIQAKELEDGFIAPIDGQTYTGGLLTPALTVVYKENVLQLGKDYRVDMQDNIHVYTGGAKVTITGIGNYTGKAKAAFVVLPRDIGEYQDQITLDDVIYNGSQQKPDAEKLQLIGADNLEINYSVSYSEDVIHTGTVTVTFTGGIDFTGSFQKTYEIKKLDIGQGMANEMQISDIADQIYSQEAFEPEVTVSIKDMPADAVFDASCYEVRYEDNINAGKGKVIVTAKEDSNYTGSVTKEFNIQKKPLKADDFVDILDQEYKGGLVIKPEVVSTEEANIPEQEYTLEYPEVYEVGTQAVVKITAADNGNYSGTVEKPYVIIKRTLTDADIAAIADQEYQGNELTPEITVMNGKVKLKKGIDYESVYKNNTDVTTADSRAVVTITGIGNYDGELTAEFNITPKPIEKTAIENPVNATYTGTAIVPEDVKVTDGGKQLTKDSDYTYEVTNHTNAGTATVTITGKGNYGGTAKAAFTILPKALSGVSAEKIPDQVYTGEALKPELSVLDGTKSLTEDVDYTLTYTSNTAAGKASVVISGIGNYTGAKETSFIIQPKNLESSALDEILAQIYTGYAIEPAVTLKDGDTALVQQEDFTAVYKDNTEVGKAMVTITGKGNYTGTKEAKFQITQRGIDTVSIQVFNALPYTGEEIIPMVTVKNQNLLLTEGTDYKLEYQDNTNAGTASVTVTGLNSFAGSKTVHFAIQPRTVENAEIDQIAPQGYTGSELKPLLTVKSLGKTLVADTDYAAVYQENTNAGTAFVTIKGTGNYTESKTVSFSILPKSVKDINIAAIPEQNYTGQAVKPVLVLKDGEAALQEGQDYAVEYTSNTAAGRANAAVTGIGNYTGTRNISFTILPKSLKNVQIAPIDPVVYNGQAQEPEVKLTDNEINLVSGQDYTVAYKENAKPGTAVVVITGKGNYTETVETGFEIRKKDLGTVTVEAIKDQTYTGAAICPAVTVKNQNQLLILGMDYSVEYGQNMEAGTADVTVTGMGAYTGSVNTTFTIKPMDVNALEIGQPSAQTYTGSALTPHMTVKYMGKDLKDGSDYTVSYSDHKNAGTAKAVISGKGNYAGTKVVSFSILPQNLSSFGVAGISNQTYNGNTFTPQISVKSGTITLKKDSDYTIEITSNRNPGTAKVVIEGTGNYTGSITRTFQISMPKVSGVQKVNQYATTNRLQWNQLAGISGYEIAFRKSGEKYGSPIDVKGTSFKHTGRSSGSIYYYRVRGYVLVNGQKVYGSYSDSIKLVTNPSRTAVTVKAGAKKATITWKKTAGASGYQVYRATSKSGKYKKVYTGKKSSAVKYVNSKLKSRKSYYYKVRAYKVVDGKTYYGSYSTIKKVTVK